MLITAMYVYGMIKGAWEFNFLYGAICFIIDLIFLEILTNHIKQISVAYGTSDEEKACWRKRYEVEELKRVKLDRELYGGRKG